MRYLGGKAKIARRLTARIREIIGDAPVWEPFCGGLNMSEHLLPTICTDVDASLVALIDAIGRGWHPPENVDAELYQFARTLPESNPLHGFCSFGCSWGAKPWGGFARDPAGLRNYARETTHALQHAVSRLFRAGSFVSCASFFDVEPHETTLAIYCDPPYRGRTGYRHSFDHDAFDRRCIEWACLGVTVLVSEYSMPADIANCVWESPKSGTGLGRAGLVHTERLFHVRPHD